MPNGLFWLNWIYWNDCESDIFCICLNANTKLGAFFAYGKLRCVCAHCQKNISTVPITPHTLSAFSAMRDTELSKNCITLSAERRLLSIVDVKMSLCRCCRCWRVGLYSGDANQRSCLFFVGWFLGQWERYIYLLEAGSLLFYLLKYFILCNISENDCHSVKWVFKNEKWDKTRFLDKLSVFPF